MSEDSKIVIKEVEVQKINLNPSDVLMVNVHHDDVDEESLRLLLKQLKSAFPNNKVAVFAMGSEGTIRFTVASQSEVLYCSNCNCGKKEEVENAKETQEET